MRNIKRHIIHCSDSLHGDVNNIRRWHQQKGWKDIGYHFVIKQDGTIEYGRPLEQIGAHCKGYNKSSIGTCLIGRSVFTNKQFESLKKLHKSLASMFKDIKADAHNTFNQDKTCPNFDVSKIII